jgi:hypothetical protein
MLVATRRWSWNRTMVACLIGSSGLAAPALAQTPPKPANSPYVKLAAPWPDADQLRQRKAQAESRPLFASAEPLALVLSADFKAVRGDRTEGSTRRYPAELSVGASATSPLPVTLGTRGHFRLRNASCTWPPLRVEFRKQETAGTVFDGQSALKLVTHCRDNDDYDQHVLREYLAYRIHGLVARLAFRARLARITYVDTTGKPLTTRYGMFIEDDDDVARRAEARAIEMPRIAFKDLEPEALNTMALFEYMIGNTDVSIVKLHNVKLMVTQTRTIYPVPYDFDFSGLVDTPYANPDPKLGISTVRDRLYRGPCRSEAELAPVLETFRAKKPAIMALYDSLPDLTASYRRSARSYLEGFFSIIERPDRAKKTFVDACVRADGM